jgi:hypothetical protein
MQKNGEGGYLIDWEESGELSSLLLRRPRNRIFEMLSVARDR